jgi:hypothetical protein
LDPTADSSLVPRNQLTSDDTHDGRRHAEAQVGACTVMDALVDADVASEDGTRPNDDGDPSG